MTTNIATNEGSFVDTKPSPPVPLPIVEDDLTITEDGQVMGTYQIATETTVYNSRALLLVYPKPAGDGLYRLPTSMARALFDAWRDVQRAQTTILESLRATGQPIPYGFPGYAMPIIEDFVTESGEKIPIIQMKNQPYLLCLDCMATEPQETGKPIHHEFDCPRYEDSEVVVPAEVVPDDATLLPIVPRIPTPAEVALRVSTGQQATVPVSNPRKKTPPKAVSKND